MVNAVVQAPTGRLPNGGEVAADKHHVRAAMRSVVE